MNIIDKFFNRDIYSDLKKNITKHQWKMFQESEKVINDYYFKQWIKTKVELFPNMELRLDFGTLYFNYRLHELVSDDKPVFYEQFSNLRKIWIKDYTEKFSTLQSKFDSGVKMTQAEFDRFFIVGAKI